MPLLRLTSLLLVVLVAAVDGLTAHTWENVFAMDCDMSVHMFTGSQFEINMNLSAIKGHIDLVYQETKDRAKCICPGISDEEIKRRFSYSLESVVATLVHHRTTEGFFSLSTDKLAEDACNGAIPGPVNHKTTLAKDLFDSMPQGLEMPSTCSYDSVVNGDGCKFILKGSSPVLTMLPEDVDLDVQLFSCGTDSLIPSISVQCLGQGCASHLFFQACEDPNGPGCDAFWSTDPVHLLSDRLGIIHNTSDWSYCNQQQSASFQELFLEKVLNVQANNPADVHVTTATIEDVAMFFLDGELAFNGPVNESLVETMETNLTVPASFDEAYCATIGCHASMLGNGLCNPACNAPQCMGDMGECDACSCVNGTSMNNCERARNGPVHYLDLNECQTAESPPEPENEPSGCEFEVVEPEQFSWVCSETFHQQLTFSVIGSTDTDCKSSATPIRNCWCAQLSSCDTYSYFNSVTETNCDGPKPVEVCPYAMSTTVTNEFILPNNNPDRRDSGLSTPDLVPETNNVFYMSCQGEFGFNVFNGKLGVAISIPNWHTLFSGLKDTLVRLYSCIDQTNLLDGTFFSDFTFRFGFWRPEFWMYGLLYDPVTEYDFSDSFATMFGSVFGTKVDILNHYMPTLRDFFTDNNDRSLSMLDGASLFNLASFQQNSVVRAVYMGYEQLLGKKFDIEVEIAECPDYMLPEMNVAIVSPFNSFFEKPVPCAADSDCNLQESCVEMSYFDDMLGVGAEAALTEVDYVFSTMLFGSESPRTAPQCVNSDASKTSIRNYLLWLGGDTGGAPSTDRMFCMALGLGTYFEDAESTFTCPANGEVFYNSGDCAEACGFFEQFCDENLSDYDSFRANNVEVLTGPATDKVTFYRWANLDRPVPGSSLPANGPRVDSMQWTPAMSEVVVQFAEITNQGGLENKFFPCRQLISIGETETSTKHDCRWLDDRRLLIEFSYDSTFQLFDSITLLPNNGIKLASGASYEASSVTMVPVVPENTEKLKITVDGPSVVPVCAGAVKFNLVVTGSGGRPIQREVEGGLTFHRFANKETMQDCLDNGACGGIQSSVPFEWEGETTVTVPLAAGLGPGLWTFELAAHNWFAVEDTVYAFGAYQFEVVASPAAQLEITGPGIAIGRGDELELRASLDMPPSCLDVNLFDGNARYQYTWTAQCKDEQGTTPLDMSDRTRFSTDKPLFKAKPGSLPIGTCEFTATVVTPYQITGTATKSVAIDPSEVVAIIAGGSRRLLFSDEPVILDGSNSCDPNNNANCFAGTATGAGGDDGNLRYQWSCFNATSQACEIDCPSCNFTAPVLEIPAGTLSEKASPFTFELTITGSVGEDTTTAALIVDIADAVAVQQCPRPEVEIVSVPARVNAFTRGITIFGVVGPAPGSSLDETPLQWNEVRYASTEDPGSSAPTGLFPVDDFVAGGPTTRQNLAIRPQLLVSGKTYRFRLTATTPCNDDVDPFSEIEFTVNNPPKAGIVTVVPAVGRAVVDLFEIQASLFDDIDGDLPIRYSFEVTFDEPGEGIPPRPPMTLTDFELASSLTTSLPLPPVENAGTLRVIAVARDSLGAESSRDATTSVTVLSPVTLVPGGDVDIDPTNILRELENLGGTNEDVLRMMQSIASVANTIPYDFGGNFTVWSEETRADLIKEAVFVRERIAGDGASSPRLLALEMNTMNVLLADPAALTLEAQQYATEYALGVLLATQTELDSRTTGATDPQAQALLPVDFTGASIQALSYLADAAKQLLDLASQDAETAARRRLHEQVVGDGDVPRRLQEQEDEIAETVVAACAVIQNLKTAVQYLGHVQLFGAVPGQSTDYADGSKLRLSAARESPSNIGKSGGIQNLGAPRQGDSTQTNYTSLFYLPSNILDKSNTGQDAPDEVNILSVEWDFDVRCDEDSNTFEAIFGSAPDVAGECTNSTLDSGNLVGFKGPLTSIATVVSLDFLEAGNINASKISPSGLTETVKIRVAVSDEVLDNDGVLCGESLTTSCGYYDEVGGQGWISDGCRVVEAVPSEGFIVCECNHASDYAAWTSFVQDLKDTFNNPITSVTTFAILVLGAMLPTLVVVWYLMMWWGRRMDQRQGDSIQRGALVVLLLNRVQLQSRQREFFAIMKQRMKLEKAELQKSKQAATGKPTLQAQGSSFLGRIAGSGKQQLKFLRNWCKALQYEHSLFGLFRFDPHYSRIQRGSIFIAVVVGNLFAASFFFELKFASGLSFGFFVGVVVASSLLVGLPIKFLVKLLFRGSENSRGSKMERVAQIYRIADGSSELTATTKEDIGLVLSYKTYYQAKNKLMAVRGDPSMVSTDSSGCVGGIKSFVSRCCCRGASGENDQTRLVVSKGSISSEHDMDSRASDTLDVEASRPDAKKRAKDEFKRAKQAMEDATKAAVEAWKLDDSPTERNVKVRKQKSVLLKLAALVSEEEPARARTRKPWFAHAYVYLGWLFLLAFYAFSIFYIIRFVLTRAPIIQEQLVLEYGNTTDLTSQVVAEEHSIITSWIITSMVGVFVGYIFVEPILQFFRFTALPFCVYKMGVHDKEENLYFDELKNIGGAATAAENTADFLLGFAAEVIEGMF